MKNINFTHIFFFISVSSAEQDIGIPFSAEVFQHEFAEELKDLGERLHEFALGVIGRAAVLDLVSYRIEPVVNGVDPGIEDLVGIRGVDTKRFEEMKQVEERIEEGFDLLKHSVSSTYTVSGTVTGLRSTPKGNSG